MNFKLSPILLLAISGCSILGSKPYVPEVNPVEVVTITQPAAIYHPPLPSAVRTKPVEWRVLTPALMGEYLADLEAGEAPTNVYYGVSPTGYENLSTNMAEIKRYIRQALSIVHYYRDLDKEEEPDEEPDEERD